MDPKKAQRYKELKAKYGYDLAVVKKGNLTANMDEEEVLKSLLLFHLQNQLVEIVNNYLEDTECAEQEMAALITLLMNTTGEVLGTLSGQKPEMVLLLRNIAMSMFDSHIKEFLNGPKI